MERHLSSIALLALLLVYTAQSTDTGGDLEAQLKITSHSCKSKSSSEFVCRFVTGTHRLDTEWNVTYSTREGRLCDNNPCRNIQCSELTVINPTSGEDYVSVECKITDWIFPSLVYILSVTGSVEGVTKTSNINTLFELENENDKSLDSWMETTPYLFESDPQSYTTTVVQSLTWPSPLEIHGVTFITKDNLVSSYEQYHGYAARVGDTISISCRIDGQQPRLMMTRYLPDRNITKRLSSDNDSRITEIINYSWINVTIRNADVNDSGSYMCQDDRKELTVVEPANPPKILSHRCVSNRYHNIACTLLTNTNKHDIVDWNITFSTREMRNCEGRNKCQNLPCAITVIPAAPGEDYDSVICNITGWLFDNMIYDITVRGTVFNVTGISNISTRLYSQIVALAPPTILEHVVTPNSVNIRVQLFEEDMHTKTEGVEGYIEADIYFYGIKYRVTVESGNAPFNHTDQEVMTLTYIRGTTESWLNISNLSPYTSYKLHVYNQMNNTINTDIWSNKTEQPYEVRTLEARPEAAPEISPYGFSIISSNTCDSKRKVKFYWKRVADVAGQGNGVITFYEIYINNEHYRRAMADDSALFVQRAEGAERSIAICVGVEFTEYGLLPKNSVGRGMNSAIYYIPAQSEEIVIKPCNISVAYYKETDRLVVDRSALPREFNYTLFWCEEDIDGNCKNEDIEWEEMGVRLNSTMSPGYPYRRYKFGMSAYDENDRRSSGIVWAECVNYPDSDLQTTSVAVQMEELEATVTIEEECAVNTRRAEYFTVHSCLFDVKEDVCIGEENTATVKPCVKSVKILTKKHFDIYAFWVVSHVENSMVTSSVVMRQTERKGLTWEIGLTVVLSALAVTLFALCVVYCNRQRVKVRTMKHPQLVLPTELIMEEAEMSDDHIEEESDEESSLADDSFNTPYLTHSHPFMPLMDGSGKATPQLYENNSRTSTTYYRCDVDSDGQTLSYQPTMFGGMSKLDYKNASSMNSCAILPDEYLKCTEAEAELSMSALSAQLFYGGDSDNRRIELSKFLNHSGCVDEPATNPPDYLNKASKTLGGEANPKLAVDLPPYRRHDDESVSGLVTDESRDKLVVDVPKADHSPTVTDNDSAKLPNNNNIDYKPITEPLINSGLQTITNHIEDETIEPLIDPPENTSGDSGYVDRKRDSNTTPRSNSIASNEG